MRLSYSAHVASAASLTMVLASPLAAQDNKELLDRYRATAMDSGDAARGRKIFESKETNCAKCHTLGGHERLAGPDLAVIGDKYAREQIITSVLEPSQSIHPDYGAISVLTKSGRIHTGVLLRRSDQEIELFDGEGKIGRIPLAEVEQEQRNTTSLMPADVFKTVDVTQFADLIAFLTTLKQKADTHSGLPAEIPEVSRPVRLEKFHSDELRFDHPVWIIAKPGAESVFLIVEQMTRKVWQLDTTEPSARKTLFADLSQESISGQYEGVMCLAFHPNFIENRKYYLNYHVRDEGVFTPVIVERRATEDLSRDAGGASRRLLEVRQETDLHWGGMLAFGPDGYLYIGMGDAGPQEDPDGHGQDLSVLHGKLLRIDVDHTSGNRLYAIPDTNPFRSSASGSVRPEIWAYGFRNPWRFSWDSETGDMWVGDIGQNLFEEVTIARVGENHGWNVYEGFTPFSNRYRREDETYTPPVLSYRRRDGVSVTGGYVYRGQRSPSYVGAYIFGDFESKRIWALKQAGRQLVMIRQIGICPEQPASFGIDGEGELLIVGYQGTIFRVVLDDSVFD